MGDTAGSEAEPCRVFTDKRGGGGVRIFYSADLHLKIPNMSSTVGDTVIIKAGC